MEESRLKKHQSDVVNLNPENMKTGFHKVWTANELIVMVLFQSQMIRKKKRLLQGMESTARAEIVNAEEDGFLETEGEFTRDIRQSEIVANVDTATAAKV